MSKPLSKHSHFMHEHKNNIPKIKWVRLLNSIDYSHDLGLFR